MNVALITTRPTDRQVFLKIYLLELYKPPFDILPFFFDFVMIDCFMVTIFYYYFTITLLDL